MNKASRHAKDDVMMRKVTISLDDDELAWIKRLAKRSYGGDLSAAFLEGLHALRRREAFEDFLRMSRAPRLSEREVAKVLAEIHGKWPAPRPRRRRQAA
jgi:hypothetical protein